MYIYDDAPGLRDAGADVSTLRPALLAPKAPPAEEVPKQVVQVHVSGGPRVAAPLLSQQ